MGGKRFLFVFGLLGGIASGVVTAALIDAFAPNRLPLGFSLGVCVLLSDQPAGGLWFHGIPQANGAISVCFGVTSMTAEGGRYLTDNLYIPFAGFYPENWFVERAPWVRSLPRLLARHRKRLTRASAVIVPFTTEPLVDLNAVQHELDQLNTELGFLHPHAEREDHGKFTQEGRYRGWKEYWMLNYLGRSAKYR